MFGFFLITKNIGKTLKGSPEYFEFVSGKLI